MHSLTRKAVRTRKLHTGFVVGFLSNISSFMYLHTNKLLFLMIPELQAHHLTFVLSIYTHGHFFFLLVARIESWLMLLCMSFLLSINFSGRKKWACNFELIYFLYQDENIFWRVNQSEIMFICSSECIAFLGFILHIRGYMANLSWLVH